MTSTRLILALLLLTQGHAHSETGMLLHPFEAIEPHMGTLFRIKIYAESEAQAKAAFHSAFERVRQLDETLSDYRVDSELSRVTHGTVNQPVPVSKDLFRVLSAAQDFAELSNGAFDITLGPLTHLWHAGRKEGIVPGENSIAAAFRRCGYSKIHLNRCKQTVTVAAAGMQLDAGGIAKGYAADEALSTLRSFGIHQALVAASGDLAFSDAPPGKQGWSIGVDSLDGAGQPFTRILILANGAVSTSGDTEQHLDIKGKRYSHILDGRTGAALTNNLTVTVVAPSGMEADAAATALSVLGGPEGFKLVNGKRGMAVLFVDRTESPAAILQSAGFALLTQTNGH